MSTAEKIIRAKNDYDEVYAKGIEVGKSQGGNTEEAYNQGFEAGKQAEYNAFWDEFLIANPTSSNTNFLFSGKGWNDTTFKPNKDLIVPNWTQRYFHETGVLDVKARLEELGVKLDLSKCTNLSYLCMNTQITRLPELDCRNINDLSYFIQNNTKLVSIDKVVLNDSGNQTFANTSFGSNSKLEQVAFEGCIGQSFSISLSPLNIESARSIINALKDYSGTTTTKTLTLSSTTKSLLTETDIANITQKGWTLA